MCYPFINYSFLYFLYSIFQGLKSNLTNLLNYRFVFVIIIFWWKLFIINDCLMTRIENDIFSGSPNVTGWELFTRNHMIGTGREWKVYWRLNDLNRSVFNCTENFGILHSRCPFKFFFVVAFLGGGLLLFFFFLLSFSLDSFFLECTRFLICPILIFCSLYDETSIILFSQMTASCGHRLRVSMKNY